jgi:hypothetical protein
MGWRFRHSFKVIPGVKFNLSKSGLSCSIGGAPLTMNIGPPGVYGTASIPGTGISYRQRFSGGSETQPALLTPTPTAPVLPPSGDPHSSFSVLESRAASAFPSGLGEVRGLVREWAEGHASRTIPPREIVRFPKTPVVLTLSIVCWLAPSHAFTF